MTTPSLSVQQAYSALITNSIIFRVLLWGMYTIIYLGTLSVYLNKRSSRNWLVIGAISLSYFAYSGDAIIYWYRFQNIVSYTSESLWAAGGGSAWDSFVDQAVIFVVAAIADGILIWRCFNVRGRSFWAISIPTFLLCCEIALDLAALIPFGTADFNPSASQIAQLNRLVAAQAFITFATTLICTILIGTRIYKALKADMPRNSRRTFKHVFEILIQSAALYSLAAIAQAISLVVPETVDNLIPWDAAETYTSELFLFISGVAPTILVGRVAMLDEKDREGSTVVSRPTSGLHFQAGYTTQHESQTTANGTLTEKGGLGAGLQCDDAEIPLRREENLVQV